MAETLFPPSPNWGSPKVFSTREDGSIVYGSQNDIVILRHTDHKLTPLIITDPHSERITSVAFSPVTNNHEKLKNLVLSSSDDGFVKLCSIDTLLPVKGHNSHKNEKESSVVKVVSASWSRCNSQYIVSAAENDTLILWDAIANTTKLFWFTKLKPSVLECSYHNELIVAVGSKSGIVVIIRLANKGEVIYKLRGHDKEVQALSWCPTFGKFAGSTRFEHYLLASSSQEKEIFIWNTKLGIDEVKIQLPKNPFSKTKNEHHGKWEPIHNFVPIIWSDTYILYSGTKFGELISCDLKNFLTTDTETQKMSEKEFNQKVFTSWSLNHTHHSKAIVAISVCPNIVDHKNHEKDCTNDGDMSLDVNARVNCYFSPANLIWTLGRDLKLTAVYENSDQTNPVFNLLTLNGHAFEAVVSPHDPNQLAIASGDGRIRIWNALKSSGKSSMYWKKISDRIYSLAWHPIKERILAYGTSEGRVGLIEVYSQKQPMCFKAVHYGKVYRAAWGPPYAEDENRTLFDEHEFWLYSIGGYKLIWHDPIIMRSESVKLKMNSGVSCTKFTDLCWKPDYSLLALAGKDGNIYLLKPPRLELVYTIDPSKKSVQSLVWHPTATTLNSDCSGFHGYFTFGSTDTDSAIKVYNYFIQDDIPKVEQVTSLEGHSGHVQSVSWSPHISGRLISTSADYTVRIWDVTTDRQLAKFVISHSLLPLFSIWSPLDPDVIISGYALRIALTWRISTTSNIDPIIFDRNVGRVKNFEKSDLLNNLILSDSDEKRSTPAQKDGMCGLPLATNASLQQLVKEKKMFRSAWKSDVDPLTNCYKLLNGRGVENINFLLPFLDAENIFYEFLNKEAILHETSNNWNECYELAMWRGNLKEILEEKVKTGHLDDFLVSLAPFVSPRLWHEACVSYSKTLFANKLYRKAACYLLAIHKIYDAIDLLLNSNLFLEALCIARCRLPESDPIFNEIVKNYAEWLTVTGSFLKASECLLYLGEYSQAARLLLNKKDHPEYLSLAALAFRKAGCEEKELQYSFSALLLSLTALNQDLASRICNDHGTLKPLSLVHKTHNLIYQLDTGKLECREDLISHLKELTDASGDQSSYKFLSYIYDRNTLHTDKNKLYVAVARELSLASCIDDKEIILTHIIRALNSASKYMVKSKDEINFLFKLCTWLSPKGYFSENSIFMWSGVNIIPKITSLRAFLCQGIAEHLDFVLSEKDEYVDQNLVDCLKGLVGDVLNKDAFNYFKNQVEIKSGEMRINSAYQTKNERISENDEDGMNKNVIASEMDKINKRNSDLKIFENSRIIAPNPAFVYCILRRVSEMLSVADVELSATIEQKWNELQMT